MVCSLLQKIELLHTAGTQFTPPNAPELVQSFYEIMTIRDDKGLALLAFDGIIVAATTFAAEKGGVFNKRGLVRWLAILVIFFRSARRSPVCSFRRSRIRSTVMSLAPRPIAWTSPTRSTASRTWSIGAPIISTSPGGARSSRSRCLPGCSGCR